jgi:hypothetical protein
MTTKHQVTDSKGKVHKRISVNRVYSHAIVTHFPAIESSEVWRAREAYSKAEFASTLANAEKVAARSRRCGFEAEIIEVQHGAP